MADDAWEACALRLKIAIRRKHNSALSFFKEIASELSVDKGAFYGWQRATDDAQNRRKPQPPDARLMERKLGVRPGWLLNGAGESNADLNEALDALVAKKYDDPVLQAVLANLIDSPAELKSEVNQLTGNVVPFSGKFSPNRLLPILSGDKILQWLENEMADESIVESWFSIPREIIGDPKAFVHIIPEHDHSMTGNAAVTLPPRTRLIISPASPVMPGQGLLIRRKDHGDEEDWLVRRYVGALRYGQCPFDLEAINASYKALRNLDPKDWVLAGRIAHIMLDVQTL